MKTHHSYLGFALWREPALVARAVRPEHLAFARLEPVTRTRIGAAIVDLTFVQGGRTVVVPFIQVDVNRILQRDGDVLVWPANVARWVDADAAAAIDDRLREWLEDLSFGRTLNRECWRDYEPSDLDFARARELDLLGAAPLEAVVPRVAPYMYARRFARGRTIGIDDAGAAAATAILQTIAGSIDAAPPRNDDGVFANAWFGVEPRPLRDDLYDVTIRDGSASPSAAGRFASIVVDDAGYGMPVAVVQPAPLDLVVSYEPADAPTLRMFGVRAIEAHSRTTRIESLPPAAGGSTGHLLFVVRPNAVTSPDGDVESVHAYAKALRAEGIDVDVRTSAGDLEGIDLVHVFVNDDLGAAVAAMRSAVNAGVPFVASLDAALVPESVYDAIEQHVSISRIALHESQSAIFARALAAGAITVEGADIPPEIAEREAARPELRTLLAAAQAVLVHTQADRTAVKAAFGSNVPTSIVGALLAPSAVVPTAPYVGTTPYVLVAAPIEPKMNQLIIARALRDLDTPVVFAGAVSDVEYLERVRLSASDDAMFVTDPSPELVHSLYSGASVVLDAAYVPHGIANAIRAAIEGAALVVPSGSSAAALFGETAWQCQPLADPSIREAVGNALRAPDRDARIARSAEIARAASSPAQTLGVVLSAYASTAPPVAALR